MGSRLKDLVILIALVGSGAYWMQHQGAQPNVQATPTPAAATSEPGNYFPDTAPPFELHSNLGPPRKFDGKGPLVVVLTAVGCGDCVTRIPRDKEIYEMAKKAGIPYYNILVYVQDDAQGAQFVAEHQPAGDDILNDPGGLVFVGKYKGSDNNCQMVIGRQGEFLYRGPENKEAMARAISSL
ncbi:hypothetical protein JST97_33570 [bacterium]|nr:hypothetical protein [bacterium]